MYMVQEMWEGKGGEVIFKRRELARDINQPLDLPGSTCHGYPPIALAGVCVCACA